MQIDAFQSRAVSARTGGRTRPSVTRIAAVRSGPALFLALAFAASARAAEVRLPLDGYCRPGRFFPAVVTADAAVTVAGDGCVPCDVAGGFRGVLPVLVVGPVRTLSWPGGSRPLRTPEDGHQLVGAVSPDAAATAFPDRRTAIVVQLDPADPLPGPAAAWEALDAVVLDPAAMGRLTDDRRSTLLAGGVTLVSTGDERPDARWPWHRRGPGWALVGTVRGPPGVVEAAVLSPTDGWAAGWPATVRYRVLAGGVLVTLAAAAACLLRNRRAAVAVVAVSATATIAVAVWRSSLGTVATAGGDVVVTGGGLVQRDRWVYDRGRSTGPVAVAWNGWTHPAFASATSLDRAGLRLSVAADGTLSFAATVRAGAVVGFVHRDVRPAPPLSTLSVKEPSRSPMGDLARDLYLTRGDRIAGDVPATAAGRWDGVQIRKP